MNAKVNILLPIGESVGLKKATLAPRLQSLQGKTIGVLSNSWQCMTFVADELRMRLVSDYGAKEVLKFFEWSFKNGAKMADDLDYVPMPDTVTKAILSAWKTQIKDASGKAVY